MRRRQTNGIGPIFGGSDRRHDGPDVDSRRGPVAKVTIAAKPPPTASSPSFLFPPRPSPNEHDRRNSTELPPTGRRGRTSGTTTPPPPNATAIEGGHATPTRGGGETRPPCTNISPLFRFIGRCTRKTNDENVLAMTMVLAPFLGCLPLAATRACCDNNATSWGAARQWKNMLVYRLYLKSQLMRSRKTRFLAILLNSEESFKR